MPNQACERSSNHVGSPSGSPLLPPPFEVGRVRSKVGGFEAYRALLNSPSSAELGATFIIIIWKALRYASPVKIGIGVYVHVIVRI